jgi:hypothetical protein
MARVSMEGALRPNVSQYHGLNTDALTSTQNMSYMNSQRANQNVSDSADITRRHGGQNIATNTSHSKFAYENAMAQQESKENFKTPEELRQQELLEQAMVKKLRPKYVPPPKEMYHHTSPPLTERQQMEMEMYHQTVQSEKNNRMGMYRR